MYVQSADVGPLFFREIFTVTAILIFKCTEGAVVGAPPPS